MKIPKIFELPPPSRSWWRLSAGILRVLSANIPVLLSALPCPAPCAQRQTAEDSISQARFGPINFFHTQPRLILNHMFPYQSECHSLRVKSGQSFHMLEVRSSCLLLLLRPLGMPFVRVHLHDIQQISGKAGSEVKGILAAPPKATPPKK